MKYLVVVESPAKAKTIKTFLGKDYEVIASYGHLRDLPKSSFGIKVEDKNFIPEYRVPKDSSKIVKQIKDLAKKAETIYLATDEDREGEAIAYHIACAIKKDPESLPRIVFHEITKSAIQNAIENPRTLDMDKVNAQQARRLLDRIVGYSLSPLLASKIQKGLSAGRVQSSALKIIIDREKEITSFKPIEYWLITANFENVESTLVEYKNKAIKKLDISSGDQAKEIENTILKENFKVESIVFKDKTSRSPAPYMTSSLQQSASSSLGFSPKKTMVLAQKLYEGVKTPSGTMGVITYMRTDSLNLSSESISKARELIDNNYGSKYLPTKPKYYTTKAKGAQEAHEAIRPTVLDFTPEIALKFLEKDAWKLYNLIYTRFLASQMNDAKFQSQNIIFSSPNAKFKANGRKLVFDGFYKVYSSVTEDKLLPDLEENKKASMDKLELKQNFTEPPPRFSEAALIKTLESEGIGRPSTYAPTISTLEARKYIEIDKKRILPTEIASTVIGMLEEHFSQIVNSSFTSNIEEQFDKIAYEKEDWEKVLYEFYAPFKEQVQDGKKNIVSLKKLIPTGEDCPECKEPLITRTGRFGEFVGCSAYPKCKYIKKDKKSRPEPEKAGIDCPKCEKPLVKRISKRGPFLGCSGFPKCKFIAPLKALELSCKKCNYPMIITTKEKQECPKCGDINKNEVKDK